MYAPTGECAGFGLDHEARPRNGEPDSSTRHLDGANDQPVSIDEGHIDRELHTDGVDPATAINHKSTFKVVSSNEAAAALGPARCALG